MNPILEEVYSTVLSGAPYVIAAYALIWVVLCVFVIAMLMRSRKTSADIAALREAISRLEDTSVSQSAASSTSAAPDAHAETHVPQTVVSGAAATTDAGDTDKRSLEDAIGK